jgi:hypothetical protein
VGDNGNVGFLLDKYIAVVGLNPTTVQNSLDGKNRVNARTLISEDPAVVFSGSINDLTISGAPAGHNHSLYVAAISHDVAASLIDPPLISAGTIGAVSRPYSVEFRTLIFGDSTPSGTVSVGSVTTINSSVINSSMGIYYIVGSGYVTTTSSSILSSGSLDSIFVFIPFNPDLAGILQANILANNNFEIPKIDSRIEFDVSVSMAELGGDTAPRLKNNAESVEINQSIIKKKELRVSNKEFCNDLDEECR